MEPRSSRLKDKKKDAGEILVKDQFVQDVFQNNVLLHFLCKGSSVVVLPRISLRQSICSNQQGSFQSKVKAGLFGSLCSPDLEVKTRKSFVSDCSELDINQGSKNLTGPYSMNWKYSSIWDDHNLSFSSRSNHVASPLGSQTMRIDPGSGKDQCDRVTSQGLFSCTTCGILCFASVAIVQPTETASQYLMSGDCSIFSDWGTTTDYSAAFNDDASAPRSNSSTGVMVKRTTDGLFDVPIKAASLMQPPDDENEVPSSTEARKETSSLGLLALNYGDSDSDDDEADIPVEACETNSNSSPQSGYGCDNTEPAHYCESSYDDPSCSLYNSADGIPLKIDSYELTKAKFKGKDEGSFDHTMPKTGIHHCASICSLGGHMSETLTNAGLVLSKSTKKPFAPRSDEDSSRMHIFCLQHAVQVEQQLQSIGGAHVVLLCHPDYPALEAQAKKVAKELGNDKLWSEISFREASKEDGEMIQLALDSEEAIHGNGDWAVKLGINLCYSANLSRSPLYSKQMPYNRLIYNAFGCRSIVNDVNDALANGKWSGRHRRIVVAGKWCGKVWMSNQVHHLIAERESEGQEPERNITLSVKADLKLQRPSDDTQTAEAALGKKRKTSSEARSFFKAESLVAEDPEEDFENPLVSAKQNKDNPRNKRMKTETPEPRMRNVRNGKKVEAEDSEEDFEVMSISGEQQNEDSEEDSEGLPVSGKQHNDNLRNKRMKKETPEPQMKSVRNGKQVEADDSEEDFEVMSISVKQRKEDSKEDFEVLPVSSKQHRDNLRNKWTKKQAQGPQMKSVRNGKQLQENSEEDLEVLPVSSKQLKNHIRNKRMNRETLERQRESVRHGKQLEEDSEEDFEVWQVSGKQHRNNLRIRQTKNGIPESLMKNVRNSKHLEEDSEEDSEVMPVSGQQLKNNLRKNRTKRGTLEPQMISVRNSKQLEEDSEGVSGQQLKSNLRNKRVKKETLQPVVRSVRHGKQPEEDSDEDSEVLPVSGKQHKNNARNKRMKETPEPQMNSLRNRKKLDSNSEDEMEGGPSTRLRKRTGKPSKESVKRVEVKQGPRKQNKSCKAKKVPAVKVAARSNRTKTKEEAEFKCDLEGCSMSFGSKQELILHKKNICPVKGCGKKFFSHKYLIQHRRVHLDDRPLKCPWKGCKMTFKWAWARTEHIRVHTGERPYVCAEPGCGQTFRFVSDFSRHKRKTGHISKKVKKVT